MKYHNWNLRSAGLLFRQHAHIAVAKRQGAMAGRGRYRELFVEAIPGNVRGCFGAGGRWWILRGHLRSACAMIGKLLLSRALSPMLELDC